MSSCCFAAKLVLHCRGILADTRSSIALGPMMISLLSCAVILLVTQPRRQSRILQSAPVGKANFPRLACSPVIDRVQMRRSYYIALTTRQEHNTRDGCRNVR